MTCKDRYKQFLLITWDFLNETFWSFILKLGFINILIWFKIGHSSSAAIDGDPITIGEALEAAAIAAGNKAVDQNDAAAISAAEIRASGEKSVRSGGVGETAQGEQSVADCVQEWIQV